MKENIECGVVSVAAAAAVLKLDSQTVRLLLQNKLVDWGCAYKRPGSKQYSYLIYAKPFYEMTGYICNSAKDMQGHDNIANTIKK